MLTRRNCPNGVMLLRREFRVRELLVRDVLLVRIEMQDAGIGGDGFGGVAAEELAALGFGEVEVVGDCAEGVVVV